MFIRHVNLSTSVSVVNQSNKKNEAVLEARRSFANGRAFFNPFKNSLQC